MEGEYSKKVQNYLFHWNKICDIIYDRVRLMRVFINEAFTKAINDYLKSVEQPKGVVYNSFFLFVIRLLIIIYSELEHFL